MYDILTVFASTNFQYLKKKMSACLENSSISNCSKFKLSTHPVAFIQYCSGGKLKKMILTKNINYLLIFLITKYML